MRPLQISPETAQTLARELKVPLEHLLHMPQHILMQKLAELARKNQNNSHTNESEQS